MKTWWRIWWGIGWVSREMYCHRRRGAESLGRGRVRIWKRRMQCDMRIDSLVPRTGKPFHENLPPSVSNVKHCCSFGHLLGGASWAKLPGRLISLQYYCCDCSLCRGSTDRGRLDRGLYTMAYPLEHILAVGCHWKSCRSPWIASGLARSCG
jgi:hypothetical protein